MPGVNTAAMLGVALVAVPVVFTLLLKNLTHGLGRWFTRVALQVHEANILLETSGQKPHSRNRRNDQRYSQAPNPSKGTNEVLRRRE